MPQTESACPPTSGMRRGAGDLHELRSIRPILRCRMRTWRPTTIAQRTWSTYHVASLWVGLSVCIPTYMLAAGLVGGRHELEAAIVTILLGNLIVCADGADAHAGTRYGIPFPVLARASFGIHGSNVPALMRAVVACGWFGIQTWIGGRAIYTMMKVIVPQRELPFAMALGFLAFWLLNMYRDCPAAMPSSARSLGRTVPDRVGPRPARLGYRSRGRLRLVLSQPSRFTSTGRLPGGVRALAHRDGRLLGHRWAEHPGPVALRGSQGAGVGTDSSACRRR